MFKQGTAYHSGTHEFTAGFYWGLCCSIVNFLCRCLSYWPFSFCHCVVCPSLIYRFWLLLGIFKLVLLGVTVETQYFPILLNFTPVSYFYQNTHLLAHPSVSFHIHRLLLNFVYSFCQEYSWNTKQQSSTISSVTRIFKLCMTFKVLKLITWCPSRVFM
jgi:hypothetical protein